MLGAVLVGGASRRMGVDKALIPWQGRPLARHVGERILTVCPQVVLVGGELHRNYTHSLGLPWWPDPPGWAGAGPLAGLLTALRFAPRVLLVACDLPHLDPGILRRLLAAAGRAPVAIPCLSGRLEPLVAVYGRAAVPAAQASLAAGSGRMSDLLAAPGARLIPGESLGPPEAVELAFKNLNSPGDLELIAMEAANPLSDRGPGSHAR